MRRWYRWLVVVAALLGGAALGLVTDGYVDLIDGLLYDSSLAINPARPRHAESRVVVIAVDQGSLSSARLATVPRVYLGPYFATLLHGLFQAEATAVGFDIVFSHASSRFAPMDPDYDKPLLDALAKYRDRIVLARTAYTPVADAMVAAVFDPDRDSGTEEPPAIAYAELAQSGDGVQRAVVPKLSAQDGTELPTLAESLAEIGGAVPNRTPALLAPSAPVESLPTYALEDVLKCIETSPPTMKAVFKDKVVLVGSNLVEEDRKRGPDRFMKWPPTPKAKISGGDCKLDALGPSDRSGATVAGLHIHAAAVDGLLSGNLVRTVPFAARLIASTAAAAAGGALGLMLSPAFALGAVVLGVATIFIASTLALGSGYWLPAAVPGIAIVMAVAGGQLARYLVEERRRRRVERAFGHYLAPSIVDQLAQADDELHLGGRVNEVTVMFADLSGFTAMSDTMAPDALMELVNRYFEVIVDAIETNGGYVDKFVGDAVMAMWGAPAPTNEGPAKAVACAMLILQRVAAVKAADSLRGVAGFMVKIGIATGPAIVGNVGSPHRFNYSALGATVNLAARLEKVCASFGCTIVADATTASQLADRYLFCEIASVTLKGKTVPVAVYEPIAELASVSSEQRGYVARYHDALALFRKGDFAAAAKIWTELQSTQGRQREISAASVMADRARAAL